MYSETSVTFSEHPVIQCSPQQQSQSQAHSLTLQSCIGCLFSAGGDEKLRTNLSTQSQVGKGYICLFVCLFSWRYNPLWLYHLALASSFSRFLDHTQRRATVGRTPLGEWSIRRRDLYLTKHNTHNGQTSMPPVGFEPTISAGERLKTYALDRAATGTGKGDI